MPFIKNIVIKGGVHNRKSWYAEMTEDQITAMTADLATVIGKHTREEAWIDVQFTKSVGHKINS